MDAFVSFSLNKKNLFDAAQLSRKPKTHFQFKEKKF